MYFYCNYSHKRLLKQFKTINMPTKSNKKKKKSKQEKKVPERPKDGDHIPSEPGTEEYFRDRLAQLTLQCNKFKERSEKLEEDFKQRRLELQDLLPTERNLKQKNNTFIQKDEKFDKKHAQMYNYHQPALEFQVKERQKQKEIKEKQHNLFRSELEREKARRIENVRHDPDYQTVVPGTEKQPKFLVTSEDHEIKLLKEKENLLNEEGANLISRIAGEEDAKAHEKNVYVDEISKLRQEFQEVKDQLTTDIIVKTSKQNEVEKFIQSKPEILQHLESLEQLGVQRDEEHGQLLKQMSDSDQKFRSRLKKDVIVRMNYVARDFRINSQKHMPETTKRTISENLIVNDQISKLEDRMKELETEKDELQEKSRQNRRRIRELEAQEKKFAIEACSSKKIVSMLSDKCRDQEFALEQHEHEDDTMLDLEAANGYLHSEVAESREVCAQLGSKNEVLLAEKAKLEEELRQEKAQVKTMTATLGKTAHMLPEVTMSYSQLMDNSMPLDGKQQETVERVLGVITNGLDDAPNDDMDDKKLDERNTPGSHDALSGLLFAHWALNNSPKKPQQTTMCSQEVQTDDGSIRRRKKAPVLKPVKSANNTSSSQPSASITKSVFIPQPS